VNVNFHEIHLADFLTTEGVLLRPSISETKYRMASALIDGLVRTLVVPETFPDAPAIPPPYQESEQTIRILNVLLESVKYFDKALMTFASSSSYKSAGVPVRGFPQKHVPRECL
jgi:hypothetical protein